MLLPIFREKVSFDLDRRAMVGAWSKLSRRDIAIPKKLLLQILSDGL